MNLLSALQYGVSGLSGIALILAFRIIQTEQGKPRPRVAILRYTLVFMALALCLLAINVYLQIFEHRTNAACTRALTSLQQQIASKEIYEAADNADHSHLGTVIAGLAEASDKSFAACGVSPPER